MTENEIINDLECCTREECDRCSREHKEGCKDELMKHALWVSKMLREANQKEREESDRVKQANQSLKTTAKFDFSLKDLVSRVNDVIKESIAHGGDSGGAYFCNWDGFISAVTNLLYLIDKDHELVLVVDRNEDAKIEFKKQESL